MSKPLDTVESGTGVCKTLPPLRRKIIHWPLCSRIWTNLSRCLASSPGFNPTSISRPSSSLYMLLGPSGTRWSSTSIDEGVINSSCLGQCPVSAWPELWHSYFGLSGQINWTMFILLLRHKYSPLPVYWSPILWLLSYLYACFEQSTLTLAGTKFWMLDSRSRMEFYLSLSFWPLRSLSYHITHSIQITEQSHYGCKGSPSCTC